MRLTDIYNGLVEQETQVKLANIQREWGEDAERIQMLDEALDLIKEAQDKNEVPVLNTSEALTMAAELVEQAVMEKEAEEWYTIGTEVSEFLKEAGVTEEDLAKIGEEEEEEFGRFCARLWLSKKTGENYLE
jgi:dTDP-glucose pyrophosphorylase